MPMPLSTPPSKPTNWWRSMPGQLSIVVLIGGALLILAQVTGVIDVR
jgi:hypothetical protein